MLEQDEANVPIVQDWIDKWFWRGYRLLGLVAAMMDYMLPEEDHELEGGLRALLREADARGALPGPGVLRDPPAAAHRAGDRREGVHQPPGLLDPLPVQPRGAFNTTVPPPRGARLDVARSTRTPSTGTTGRCGSAPAASQEQGKRFFFQGLPMLCQVCQIPMGFTEPGDPTTLCVRDQRVPRRAVQLLLRRLQVDLRPGAGEVRAGVAAGAPDLPGQLRGHDHPRGAGLVRHQGRGRQRRVPDVAGQDQLGQVALRVPWWGARDGRQGALRLRLPVEGPPGVVRRRHPGQRLVDEQHDVRLGRLLPGAQGDVVGGLQVADDRPVGRLGSRLRPVDARGLADERRGLQPCRRHTLDDTGVGHKGLFTFRT